MRENISANGTEKQTDWNNIDWKAANRRVRNLRQRIFRASQEGNLKKVRSLQKLMLKSYSNTLVSVRRVTQINAGKETAGIDKLTVKTPAARGKLVDELMTFQPWRAKPARRFYIPKANGKLRPLGIPSIIDRCLQARVKNALEPFWEARFEGISYGFRPGRGCHDAIEKIHRFATPQKRKKWIIDADISGAFDNISHEYLLQTIGQCPGYELIKQWLKAGYVDRGVFHLTDTGTPQASVISLLLANIALHGMEKALGVEYNKQGVIRSPRAIVRYADDFVVFCESQTDAEAAKQDLQDWLKIRGLNLSEEKTRIVHLTEGFDFLGFNVRLYSVSNTKTGYKLLIKPNKQAVQKHRDRLREIWFQSKGDSLSVLLKRLNPVIRGWANYHRKVVASRIFQKLNHWMFQRQVRYVKRMHPNKATKWTQPRYWGRLNPKYQDNWVFGQKQTGQFLLKHSWFKIERHTLVRGTSSPDDPKLRQYWLERNKQKATDFTPSIQKIAQKQNHLCPLCGESLYNDEELHLHHIEPRKAGGKDRYDNYLLLHLYCHQQVTANMR